MPLTPAKSKPHPRDAVREVFETVVFVVVLVLMLKLFVVEAFVIPTGSMAETLLGYNKLVKCPDCGYEYPVNASNEVDPWDGQRQTVVGACCPNCRFRWEWKPNEAPANRSGDRVLVHKALYEFGKPERGDVVVFKYPVDPQINHTAQNYIKRLWGLGGETIAIYNGDLYLTTSLQYPTDVTETVVEDGTTHQVPLYPRADDPLHLWEGSLVTDHSKTSPRFREGERTTDYTYNNAPDAVRLFEESRKAGFSGANGGFALIRKTDAQALAMRRIVYDNDHQSSFLARHVPPRWSADDGGWKGNDGPVRKVFTHSGDGTAWLRYRHRVKPEPTDEDRAVFGPRADMADRIRVEGGGYKDGLFPPSPITNFLGYNSGEESPLTRVRQGRPYWVGDLMLECRAKVSGPSDELVLELSKGVNRYQARFAGGQVTILRNGGELATRPTRITSSGTYDLRFANVDCRLRVWVDGTAIDFGDAADYPPAGDDADLGSLTALAAVAGAALTAPAPDGHTVPNDVLAPAGIGARGTVEVSKLVLWNDTYFTPAENPVSAAVAGRPLDTFYVQPGHYLCLGDNSGQSSDSRKWGLVPERLMLGKAVFVFFPLSRIGFIQ